MFDPSAHEWVQNFLPGATLIICFVSGLLPVVNAELYLIAISPLVIGTDKILMIGLMAGVGQIMAKSCIYLAASKSLDLKFIKKRFTPKRTALWHAKIEEWGWKVPFFTFSSALFGFPPILILSFVLGATRANYWMFLSTGLIGRSLRFTAIVAAPSLAVNVLSLSKFSEFLKNSF